jgi:anti-anti-sigma factor
MSTAPEAFTIDSQTRGRRRRIVVAGEVDLLAAMRLRSVFDRLVADTDALIEVDLRRVTFMDSTGVHLLGYMRRRAYIRLFVFPSEAVRAVVHLALEAVREHDVLTLA